MRILAYNVTHGKFCLFNMSVPVVGAMAQLALKEQAQIYAALATGVWMTLQATFLLIDRIRKRKA